MRGRRSRHSPVVGYRTLVPDQELRNVVDYFNNVTERRHFTSVSARTGEMEGHIIVELRGLLSEPIVELHVLALSAGCSRHSDQVSYDLFSVQHSRDFEWEVRNRQTSAIARRVVALLGSEAFAETGLKARSRGWALLRTFSRLGRRLR